MKKTVYFLIRENAKDIKISNLRFLSKRVSWNVNEYLVKGQDKAYRFNTKTLAQDHLNQMKEKQKFKIVSLFKYTHPNGKRVS